MACRSRSACQRQIIATSFLVVLGLYHVSTCMAAYVYMTRVRSSHHNATAVFVPSPSAVSTVVSSSCVVSSVLDMGAGTGSGGGLRCNSKKVRSVT